MNSLFLALQDVHMDAEQLFQEMNGMSGDFGGDFGGDVAMPTTIFALFFGVICFALSLSFIISAITTYFIYKPYSQLPQQFQTLAPGLIWLLLVPLVNVVMVFLVALQVPDAFKRYFNSVGNYSVGDCGKMVGLIWAIAVLCSFVPFLNYIAWIPALVCMVMFMVKLWDMARQIHTKALPQKIVVPEL